MLLFIKNDCGHCQYLKKMADFSNIKVYNLDGDLQSQREGLALLAFYECYIDAQKSLPLLIIRSPVLNIITDFKMICQELDVEQKLTADCSGDNCKI